MSRIKDAFQNGKAFIPFITCGDPDLNTTIECVKQMVANGASIVELGIPFSDPTAEGPVIQGANLRALTGGVTTDKIFDMVETLIKRSKHSLGIHDLCERGIFLRFREVFGKLPKGRN